MVGDRAWWFIGVIEQHLFELAAMHPAPLIDVFEIPLGPQTCHAVAPHSNGTSEASARANFDLRVRDALLSGIRLSKAQESYHACHKYRHPSTHALHTSPSSCWLGKLSSQCFAVKVGAY